MKTYYITIGGIPIPFKKWESVGISVIHFGTSNPKDYKVLYSDKSSGANDSLAKWKLIKLAASRYKYAEQAPLSVPLKNWPNSKYGFPPSGNNSNTFGREMGRVIGRNAGGVVIWPGASSPNPVKYPGYTPGPKP